MHPDEVPFLPRGVRTQRDKVRNTEVLLGPERVLMLDQIGIAVLKKLDGTRSLRDISLELSSIYDASIEVIEPDVVAFVQNLKEKGMIHVNSR